MRGIEILARLEPSRMRFGLERVQAAVERLGHPERKFPSIHVAGTNGKGSTCAFLESVLRASGRRVGLYTSPHLSRFNERIAVQGAPISDDQLASAIDDVLTVLPGVLEGPEALTYFEFTTVVAFQHFARLGVDVAVLETGLGGRLDATNVVTPICSVITRIALDHTEILGPTLSAIAREKAGIFKPGVAAVSGPQDDEAARSLETEAGKNGAPLRFARAGTEPRFSFRAPSFHVENIALPLIGQHQMENAAIACQTLDTVAERLPFRAEHVALGLQTASWPGRLERRGRFLLDGAHNPNAAAALRRALDENHPGPRRLVFGVLADKDHASMSASLFGGARAVHLVRPRSPRAVDPARLVPEALRGKATPHVHATVFDGLRAALEGSSADETLVVCGSLYLVGEARELLDQQGRIRTSVSGEESS
jgi:dihydrofolate synthase / folylpolyglutamate synthase